MSARFKNIEDMPPGMRKLFQEQYLAEHQKAQAKKLAQEAAPVEIPAFQPHRAIEVCDEVALAELNKTEARYLEILKARDDLVWIGVKAIRLRLAANTHYTPDFATLDKAGILSIIDTKGGHTWEDAQLKMKLVARLFPFLRVVKVEIALATKRRAESIRESVMKS